MSAKQKICQLFNLPSNEIIYEDFGCALQRTILNHGRMFVSENYLCFYANLMGINTKKIIAFDDIINIEKKTVLGLIPNAIQIVCNKKKSYFFCSFYNREYSFQIIYSIWKGTSIDQTLVNQEQQLSDQLSQDYVASVDHKEVEYLQMEAKNPKEVLKLVLPLTIQQFFDIFIADDCVFSFQEHYKMKGEREIEMSKWSIENELQKNVRTLQMIVNLPDLPYPYNKFAKCYRVEQYELQKDKLIWSCVVNMHDAPYSSCYQCEDEMIVTPYEQDETKCLIIVKGWTVFNKSCFVKSIIEKKAFDGIKQNYEQWVKNFKQKKIVENYLNKDSRQITLVDNDLQKAEKIDPQVYEDVINKTQIKPDNVKKMDNKKNLNQFTDNMKTLLKVMSVLFILMIFMIVILISLQMQYNEDLMKRIDTMEEMLSLQQAQTLKRCYARQIQSPQTTTYSVQKNDL